MTTTTTTTTVVIDDGGRAAAGFKGKTGDCFTRALAIATGLPYAEAYALTNTIATTETLPRGRRSNARTGVWTDTAKRVMASLGWTWTPTMGIGTGTTVHLRADELPPGRLICRLSKHYCAVIDGVVHDTYDDTREGTRAVYGVWLSPGSPKWVR